MKKDLFHLRTIAVVAGLIFLLMHGEVVLGKEDNNTDSKSDSALELRDQNLLKTEEKKERFERRKRKVLENVRKRHALLSNFASCIKSANSHEDIKSCKNRNKERMGALHAERKEMRGKIGKKREWRRNEMN